MADTQRLSLQEIWHKGCQGEALHEDDVPHFHSMARSRFHTFLLGMQHAEGLSRRGNPSSLQARLLVNGLIKELRSSPGLATAWLEYDFANSEFGKPVTEGLKGSLLERLGRTLGIARRASA